MPPLFPNALPPPTAVEATLRLTPSGVSWQAVILCPYCGLEHSFAAGPHGRAMQNVVLSAPCASAKERRAGSRRVCIQIDDEAIRAAIHARLNALLGVGQT